MVYSRSFGGDPHQSLLFKRGPCPQLRRDITVRCQWDLCRAYLWIILHHHHFNFSSQVGRRARLVGSQSLPMTQHHLNLTTANDSYLYHLSLGPTLLHPHLPELLLHVLIPCSVMLDPCRVDPTVSPSRTQPSQLAVYIVSLSRITPQSPPLVPSHTDLEYLPPHWCQQRHPCSRASMSNGCKSFPRRAPSGLPLHHPCRTLPSFPPSCPFQRPLSHHHPHEVSQFRSVIARVGSRVHQCQRIWTHNWSRSWFQNPNKIRPGYWYQQRLDVACCLHKCWCTPCIQRCCRVEGDFSPAKISISVHLVDQNLSSRNSNISRVNGVTYCSAVSVVVNEEASKSSLPAWHMHLGLVIPKPAHASANSSGPSDGHESKVTSGLSRTISRCQCATIWVGWLLSDTGVEWLIMGQGSLMALHCWKEPQEPSMIFLNNYCACTAVAFYQKEKRASWDDWAAHMRRGERAELNWTILFEVQRRSMSS